MNTNIINIPEDFKVSCTLNYLETGKVLQAFIDHVSFFCALAGGYIKGYSEATTVISEYSFKVKAKEPENVLPNANLQSIEMGVKYVRQLVSLALEKGKTAEKKRKKSRSIIDSLYNAIGDYTYCPEKIYLNEETPLLFTKDFRILCEMHGCYPKDYLEYFMSKISIAEGRASAGLKIRKENHSLTFFYMLSRGYYKLRPPVIKMTEALMNFIDEAQELDARVFIIRDLNKRIAAYRDFYKTHYLNILNENQQS